MTDSYYELIDDADPLGEKFCATDLVRSTWTADIQHAGPVSALLVRALERCAARDDTRLSRVAIDLLGPVPADGDMWVRSKVERPGKQIELISAETLALGPDGQPRPTARATGWRLQQLDTAELAHASAPLPAPLSEARSRDLAKNFDRNYVHSLDWRWLTNPLNEGPGESWIKPTTNLVAGETMTQLERPVRGRRLRQRHRLQNRHHQVDVLEQRPRRARAPDSRRRMGRHPGRDQLRTRRHRHHRGHAVRRGRSRGQHSAVGARAPTASVLVLRRDRR